MLVPENAPLMSSSPAVSNAKSRKRDLNAVESSSEVACTRASRRKMKKKKRSKTESPSSDEDAFAGNSSGDEFKPDAEEKRYLDSDDDDFLPSGRTWSPKRRPAPKQTGTDLPSAAISSPARKPSSSLLRIFLLFAPAKAAPRKTSSSENKSNNGKTTTSKWKETAGERILRETYENVGPEAFANSLTAGRPRRSKKKS